MSAPITADTLVLVVVNLPTLPEDFEPLESPLDDIIKELSKTDGSLVLQGDLFNRWDDINWMPEEPGTFFP